MDRWTTNALSRWDEFCRIHTPTQDMTADVSAFIRRLVIDPFDIDARRDAVGEWYAIVYRGGRLRVGVGYVLDTEYRHVDVVGFEMVRQQ